MRLKGFFLDKIGNIPALLTFHEPTEKDVVRYRRRLLRDPDNVEIRFLYGMSLYSTGKYDEGREQVETVAATDSNVAKRARDFLDRYK